MDIKDSNKQKISKWWEQIQKWRTKNSLGFINSDDNILNHNMLFKDLYELNKRSRYFYNN